MIPDPVAFVADVLPELLQGLRINFAIAGSALVAGLAGGAVLALLIRARIPLVSTALRGLLALLRATPMFIAIFFMAGVLRQADPVLGRIFGDPQVGYVVLASLPYILSVAADQVLDTLRHVAAGDRRAAWLIIPNIARSFQVLVATSCFGAAIGVPEAMSVIIGKADLMTEASERFALFAVAIVVFIVVMQSLVLTSRLLHRLIDRRLARAAEGTA